MFFELSLRSGMDKAERKVFQPGEWLFRQGEEPENIIIIEKGKVGLMREGVEQDNKEFSKHSPRSVWGLKELLFNSAFQFSAKAEEVSRCILVPGEVVEELIRNEPGFRLRIMDLLAEDLGHALPDFE